MQGQTVRATIGPVIFTAFLAIVALVASACGSTPAAVTPPVPTPTLAPISTQTPFASTAVAEPSSLITGSGQRPGVVSSPFPPLSAAPVACEVLPAELCQQAELVSYETQQFGKNFYVGFRQLPVGTQLVSVLDGERTTLGPIQTATSPFLGCYGISLFAPRLDPARSYTFIGDIQWPTDPGVRRGETVARVADRGIRAFGLYQLVFTADEDVLRRLFPVALASEARRFVQEGPQPTGAIITNPRYYEKPP